MVIGLDGQDERRGRRPRGPDAGRGGRRGRRLAQGARPAREARELPARGRHLRALPLADRAADLAAVVVPDGGAGAGRRSRRCASGACASTPSRSTGSRSPRSRRSRTGASRGSSGGATSCRSGRRPTARRSARRPRRRRRSGRARASPLTRDPDVLDTWFSSALWPFATLGWPDETPELATYYPGNVNSTAREIIRLWENRMIWAGLEVMGEVPFTDVIIHSTVLATDGRRMSKSLGTGVDPLEMIDAHGADATRYGLLKISSTPGRALLARRDRGGAQAREQALERLAADPPERRGSRAGDRPDRARGALDPAPGSTRRATQVEEAWAAFDFATAANVLYHLTFDDFCDWYAEAVKPRLYEHEPAACATALAALERLLALLHPVLPHVTEEIWSHLPGRADAADRLALARARRPLRRRGRGARARAGGGRDVSPQRRAGRARLRRRAPDLRRGRAPGAAEGAGRRRPGDRAAAEGDRARRGDARERAVRRAARRPPSSRRSAPSSSGSRASSRRSPAAS